MSTFNRWGREYRQVVSNAQDRRLKLASEGPAHCPKCNRLASSRVFNSAINAWEYKHTRRVKAEPSGSFIETVWCKVAV